MDPILLTAVLFLFLAVLIAGWAISKADRATQIARQASAELAAIRQTVSSLERRVGELTGRPAPPDSDAAAREPPPAAVPEAAETPPAIRSEPRAAAETTAGDAGEPAGPGAPAPAERPATAEPPPVAAPPAASQGAARGLEEKLASHWMVWLGAAAVGLSAVFLFTYAVEQGWLGPEARVGLGIALGAALIAAGEWMHRHPVDALRAAVNPDYVPPALTASGLFALFVSLFAAHGLYGLISAAVAFATLGAVAFAALLLALRQGWLVGLLGLVGGYLVPMLLESDAPNALPVFLFLFVLSGGCLALMVWRKWWWLSYATLIGALGWQLLWLAGPWTIADQGVLGAYGVGIAALFAVFSVGLPVRTPGTPATAWLAAMLADTSGLGFVLSGALVVLLAMVCDFNETAFVFLGLYAVVGLAFGIRRAAFESLAVAAALVVAIAFLLWPPPAEIVVPPELRALGIESDVTSFGPYLMPEEFKAFARALLGFAVLFGLGGVAALPRAATPAVWSALAAGMPIFLLVIGYWRIAAFEVDVRWSALAAGLSVFQLAAAAAVPRLVGPRPVAVPLSFLAAGCTAALALAFTCLLREAWLTVALSMEVLALAWIWTRLRVEEIKIIALIVIAIVVVRLVLNYRVVDYDGSVAGIFSWVLYGYGLPAAAMFGAARLFRADPGDPLVALCDAVGTGLAFLMVALQLRVWTSGSIADARYDLFDQAVQSVWWLLAAGLLLRREIAATARWAWYGGLGLLTLAGLQIALGQVIRNNPLLADEPVGAVPVFNLLFLAYALPALLLWLLARRPGFALDARLRQGLMIGASALVFVFLSLEVRHAFWGSAMQLTRDTAPTNGEIYAYSAAWIVYALLLLAFGIVQQASFWRYSSLAVLIVTVLKVFLYDMSDLTGLYRVGSFLGLGLTLIAIGHIYRRFVFRA